MRLRAKEEVVAVAGGTVVAAAVVPRPQVTDMAVVAAAAAVWLLARARCKQPEADRLLGTAAMQTAKAQATAATVRRHSVLLRQELTEQFL